METDLDLPVAGAKRKEMSRRTMSNGGCVNGSGLLASSSSSSASFQHPMARQRPTGLKLDLFQNQHQQQEQQQLQLSPRRPTHIRGGGGFVVTEYPYRGDICDTEGLRGTGHSSPVVAVVAQATACGDLTSIAAPSTVAVIGGPPSTHHHHHRGHGHRSFQAPRVPFAQGGEGGNHLLQAISPLTSPTVSASSYQSLGGGEEEEEEGGACWRQHAGGGGLTLRERKRPRLGEMMMEMTEEFGQGMSTSQIIARQQQQQQHFPTPSSPCKAHARQHSWAMEEEGDGEAVRMGLPSTNSGIEAFNQTNAQDKVYPAAG